MITGRVRGYLLRRFGAQVDDIDDSEGWIAEHVLVAAAKFDVSRSGMPLSAWCCLCVRSRMLDELRRRRILTISLEDAQIE